MRPLDRQFRCLRSRQVGAVVPLFVIGMIAIIGIAGLALDGGHSVLSKSRLQNVVDAAALSAAKTLDETEDTVLAEAAALAMFDSNTALPGNAEMAARYAAGTLAVTVEFSTTLNPFVPGSAPADYVRVRAENFELTMWFSAILGVTDKIVAARAVAGPSPTIDVACNVMPMMVCGDPDAGAPYWGYTPGQPDVLKSSTTNGNWEVGPGNFQLIRLGDGQGGAYIREAMAGTYDACLASDDVIDTEPGNTVGPVVQGLNTRFGSYQGPMAGQQTTYPPDVVTTQPNPPLTYDTETDQISQGGTVVTNSDDIDFNYQDYQARVESGNFDYQPIPIDIGAYQRREAAIAIGDCSESTNGQGQLPLLGFGCFFLLQEASQQGNESHVYGEFVENCRTGGRPGPAPTEIPGPYIIQLYRDFGSRDS